MKRLVVASANPVKCRAVERGFERLFQGEACTVRGHAVGSGVSEQPFGNAETLAGALERAERVRRAAPAADLWFGIEGGVEETEAGLFAFAWVVALSRDAVGRGRTAAFQLPPRVVELVRGGMELGDADDRVFGRRESKRHNGAIGLLSGDVVDRAGLYSEGVIMALLPFRNPGLYPG
ncbi:MAG: inosine/xanthosine triphosphatase [Wenzhouxiangellaceae bacterium]|nr:inosine/xanthosine triphosphatase [Wenzhouxiangellaceae bacterium]